MELELYLKLYEDAYTIRRFETRLLELFSTGKLFGTTHTYVGQEATAVSVISNLRDSDTVFSNHRCHGHYLAKEDDPFGLLAEVMGREGATCDGRGGSQHLCKNKFYSNGIQGGFLPNALGVAFAEKHFENNNIVVAFIGDGTMGEGTVYETLNLASLWKVPLLIVIENNQYAQTTPIRDNLAGSLLKRVQAFDVSVGEIESNDISELHPRFNRLINSVRNECRPHVEIVNCYRYNAHSKGDDFRDQNEIDLWRKKDPLNYFDSHITKNGRDNIKDRVNERLSKIEAQVEKLPFSKLK
jgi:TPP-dependent pyruvate/acetoin dehydrogenase alpha subunit